MLHGFLPFSPGSSTELCSFWYDLKDLFTALVSGQSCPRPLKLMTSQVVEGTWIRTRGYGRLRGEWVNESVITTGGALDWEIWI